MCLISAARCTYPQVIRGQKSGLGSCSIFASSRLHPNHRKTKQVTTTILGRVYLESHTRDRYADTASALTVAAEFRETPKVITCPLSSLCGWVAAHDHFVTGSKYYRNGVETGSSGEHLRWLNGDQYMEGSEIDRAITIGSRALDAEIAEKGRLYERN